MNLILDFNSHYMDTKNYISTLKKKSREAVPVAMRQALCYFLYKENIPRRVISEVTGISLRLVYMSIYRAIDLLEVNDNVINSALKEAEQHNIAIRPCTIDGFVITRHVGYKMIIDNVTY